MSATNARYWVALSFLLAGLNVHSGKCAAPPAVRMSWESFATDAGRVERLRHAVLVMMDRNSADKMSAEYRTSWEYWANMHGYFGQNSKSGPIADYIASAKLDLGSEWLPEYDRALADVRDQTPPDAIASHVWDQCIHGTGPFLAWHRLYLYYFEKVLQKAAQDPNLRLPYWNYTDVRHIDMPGAFLPEIYRDSSGSDVSNPLFWKMRDSHWIPPRHTTLNGSATNVDFVLSQDDFAVFQKRIQLGGSVHGYVHCTVIGCPVTAMGAVPYSANDPIFWLHHANIDRLWSCWSALHPGADPSDDAYLNQKFSFIDADGQEITNSVRNLFDGSLIDYRYDNAEHCARNPLLLAGQKSDLVMSEQSTKAAAVAAANAKFAAGLVIADSQAELRVVGRRVSLPLDVKLGDVDAKSAAKAFVFASDPALPTRSIMTIAQVTYEHAPTTMLNVFLQNGTDAAAREYVGTLSFFGALQPPHPHHSGASEGDYAFDVTVALRKLGKKAADSAKLHLVVETTTGRPGEETTAAVSERTKLALRGVAVRAVNPSLPAK